MSSISQKNIFEKVKKLADKGASRVTQIPMLYRKRIWQYLTCFDNIILLTVFKCYENMCR